MIHRLAMLLSALMLALACSAGAQQAEAPRKAPLSMTPAGGAAAARSAPAAQDGLFSKIWIFVVDGQREMSAAMTGAIRRIKAGEVAGASVTLALVSFLYGVLHAVGPGHGKFVISAYALANERTVRRGILLSFMAAMIQALSAIVLVAVLSIVMKATSLHMRNVEAWLETFSWGLIAALGAWLLYRQVRPLVAGCGAHVAHTHPHDHGHGHHVGHGRHVHGHVHGPDCNHHDHGEPDAHGHAHEGDACAHCGHNHLPTPDQLEGNWSWRHAWSLAFSIGIRPCSGAILVLLFALGAGLFWAGVFATFAMAIGTAITVSSLAAFAVGGREMAKRFSGPDGPWALRIQRLAGIGGSAGVMVLGLLFLVASLQSQGPL